MSSANLQNHRINSKTRLSVMTTSKNSIDKERLLDSSMVHSDEISSLFQTPITQPKIDSMPVSPPASSIALPRPISTFVPDITGIFIFPPEQTKNETLKSNDVDLIDVYGDDEDPIVSMFDPCKPDNFKDRLRAERSPTALTPVTPVVIETKMIEENKTSFPFPIKLRLKLSPYAEMKPFVDFIEKFRHDSRAKNNLSEQIFYCQRVQRLTRQHIEHKQLPVSVYIFVENVSEPIRLRNVSLQSTVAHILYQLNEMIRFDYDDVSLRLRSRDEYLRHEDVLCDIEYVYHCLNSLKPLEFLLVQRRKNSLVEEKITSNLSFEQFCIHQQEKFFYTNLSSMLKSLKPLQATKSTNKTKPIPYTDCIHCFFASDPQWLEDFRKSIEQSFGHIEKRLNTLINPSKPIRSANELETLTKSLFEFIKDIQKICSDIPSEKFITKQNEIKSFIFPLSQRSNFPLNSQISEDLSRLFYELIELLMNYIKTYCDAYLIPYQVEIFNDQQENIDLRSYLAPLTPPKLLTKSMDLLTVHIASLLNIPIQVKFVRVVVRLCYGNRIRSTIMTTTMATIRNVALQEDTCHVRFDQRLTFEDIFICGLYRETVLLFEIYGNVKEKIDATETFDGIPMRLLAWASQTLFDDQHRLIQGEKCFGMIDATIEQRRAFYSLRNVFQQKSIILTVDFVNSSVIWPEVQARKDMEAKSFTEITLERQESLSKLLDRSNIFLNDHSVINSNEIRKGTPTSFVPDERREFSEDECHFLWSNRLCLVHKRYALPKLLKSRSVWDYPSLIDIYGLVDLVRQHRSIDEIEAFELLLPAFSDMFLRAQAYRSFVKHLSTNDFILYLPQVLQMLKFDYDGFSPIIKHLFEQSMCDARFAHQFYWHLRQLLQTETIHFQRYYHIFMSFLYILPEKFRDELQMQYDLCVQLKKLGLEIKKLTKPNRTNLLIEQLKEINEELFRSGSNFCRLPCQFHFLTNSIDISSCSIFDSFTLPIKLVFNPLNHFSEKYSSIYKIGDDLRQDQIVLQLFSWMDRIWQLNSLDYRLSLFNVVQVQERCGFIEMINESETMMDIEWRLGTIKGTFSESALYLWLKSHHNTERDLRVAIDNLTYSSAAYCVATYILGIGDRHNENIMVKKSGHLFHIDFGKYLGDTQKFGSFNRDRTPFIFTKQMLYVMSEGGASRDAMHRFVDLCCSAYETLRQNSSLILLLLSHLCSLNVPNLNHDAVRFVYDRLAPSLTYAESITRFTELIVDSLNSSWTTWNDLIHGLAHIGNSTNSTSPTLNGPTLSFIPNTFTVATDGKIHSALVVKYEKRTSPSKHYLYKFEVKRNETTYHYRTYAEFYEFYEVLRQHFPLIGLQLKYSQQTEDKVLAQRHVSSINDFLEQLFRLPDEIVESDVLCTFFHTMTRDQQIADATERAIEDPLTRTPSDSTTNNQSKIRIQLIYESGKLIVMVRHATNLSLKNGNEPRPYCKCRLFPDENKTTKRKGKKVSSRNPIFNDTFVYNMDLATIQEHNLRVSIWNDVLTGSNRILGEVEVILSDIDWSKESICDYTFKSS